MSAVVEFQTLMRRLAEPAVPGEPVQQAINRVARRLHITRRKAAAFWYGERAKVPSDLMDTARQLAQEPIVIEAKHELSELSARISRIEALLVQDEDFHRPFADAFREVARGPHRAMAGV